MAIYSDDPPLRTFRGAVDTKASYIDALATGRTKYVTWEYQERNFTFPSPASPS